MTQLNRRQIIDRLRTYAQRRNIAPDLARKYFMLERVLERLSKSDYRENFIIKGGFLVGSLIGIENRTTKDIDATITGIQLEQEQILSVFNEIFQDDSVDNIKFSLTKIQEIREEEFYPGYRLTVQYDLDGLKDNIKFDLTTGDSIVPEIQTYEHQSILLDHPIYFLAYPIEQVLSEKLHTIIEHNVLSTRMRDFYDVYILLKLQEDSIDFNSLKQSFENIMLKREAIVQKSDYQNVIDVLSKDQYMNNLWENYQTSHSYADGISYLDTIQAVQQILYRIQQVEKETL